MGCALGRRGGCVPAQEATCVRDLLGLCRQVGWRVLGWTGKTGASYELQMPPGVGVEMRGVEEH